MRLLKDLFDNNRNWAAEMEQREPEFFEKLAHQQTPQFFWIGCADSRVPANEIIGLAPGEVFVHRNVANVVNPADPNCMSCLQYAVEVLKVKHVIVVGHYGCGGVRAVLDGQDTGLVGEWLEPVHAIFEKYRAQIEGDHAQRWKILCDLNVVEQAAAVWRSPVIQNAWAAGQPVAIHGWIYAVGDGLLRDLQVTVASAAEAEQVRQRAIEQILTAGRAR